MHDLPLGIRTITGQATCPLGALPPPGHAEPGHTVPFSSLNTHKF